MTGLLTVFERYNLWLSDLYYETGLCVAEHATVPLIQKQLLGFGAQVHNCYH